MLVAAEVGESQRVLIDDSEETGPAAPILDVRLTLGVSRREIEFVSFADELCQLLGDGRLPAAALFNLGVQLARPLRSLNRFYGRRESGGKVEALLLKPAGGESWKVLIKPSGRIKKGARIVFEKNEYTSGKLMVDKSNKNS